ncbi:MAG: hypothetical protein CVV47_13865 [Spirochaetae bacterium HGW-Spirochaetae-3]|jgi:hypothetical protein|nr:MAG: hypothetical protein CVV47_13865 [Spirochaetae bacterium HGW-Spirochaetae-3]
MKFKTIFVLFNAILIFSFAFIFLMPLFLLGGAYALPFWGKNWPLFLLFAAVLVGFNVFFVNNWKLFSLLETEGWDELSRLLCERVFERGRYDRRTVKLLVNTSLLRGDMATVERLEAALLKDKPSALRRDAVLFGAARLLKNDAAASERFLGEYADGKGVDNPAWIGFYHAFSLVLAKRAPEASARLESSMASKDPILAVLSAFMLGTMCAAASDEAERARLVAAAEARRVALAGRYGAQRWAREVERGKSEVHIVILSKILDEASAWLLKVVEPKA